MLKMFTKWRADKKKSNELQEQLDLTRIPKHIAIIMDGNGRWAKSRHLPRIAGHKEGMNTVKKAVSFASNIGVKALTLYAFSTENWKRPKSEIEYILKLPQQFLSTYLPQLMEENVQVRIIGDVESLPTYTQDAVKKAIVQTANNTGMVLNFALNYGSRAEIIEAVRQVATDVKNESLKIDEITDDVFSRYLMTSSIGDPELMIRTSGEVRISNFLLWQIAYSELWFTDVLWPDFNEEHFTDAILHYQRRNRRFGGL